MLGSQALEVGIGLVLVFLLVSLILTAVREAIESFQKTRALDLERALAELLDDRDGTQLRQAFYNHPLIFSLFSGDARLSAFDGAGKVVKAGAQGTAQIETQLAGARDATGPAQSARALPSYIPRELFAKAIEDLFESDTISGRFKEAYATLFRVSGGDIALARKGLEQWYDAAMDRASGWYRRRSQTIVGVLGFLLAIILNINAVTIGQHLATSEIARAQVVRLAGSIETTTLPGDPAEQARLLDSQIRAAGLPIGWDKVQYTKTLEPFAGGVLEDVGAGILLLAGYAIVGLAATLGAPFWFDILGKIMVIRSTVKPTEKSPDEKSKDGGTGGAPKSAPETDAGAGSGVRKPIAEADAVPAPDRQEEGDQVVIYG